VAKSKTQALVYTPSLDRERELYALGYQRIAGVDEAGRGPLAGPVVAAAVILPADFTEDTLPQLNDSKQLKEATREELYEALLGIAAWGVGSCDAAEIDSINIRQASWLAMQRAVADLVQRAHQSTLMPDIEAATPDYVLIDGLPYGPGPWPYEAIVKGDARSLSIAAASVIAKVTRDRQMLQWHEQFPQYGFARHKGYPSPQHLAALRQHGPCILHRRTYAPVRQVG
jgi:ribonuclease HII